MLFKPDMGMIYDSIFFGIEYFNKAEVERVYKYSLSDTSFMFELYDEVSSEIDSLPAIISPFFYFANEIPTALTSFFMKFFYEFSDFEEFLTAIQDHSDMLHKMTVDSVFRDNTVNGLTPELESSVYIEAINKLEISTEFKLQISLLLSNFAFGVSQLIQELKIIYSKVVLLHKKYADKVSAEKANILLNEKVELYRQCFPFGENSEIVEISISLLNQGMIYFSQNACNVTLLVGLCHEETIKNRLNVENITAESFLTAIGHELRISIIKLLTEKDELTSSEMAKEIGCPITTLVKHIDRLHKYNIIYISRRAGLKIYYSLNVDYFKHTIVKVNELFTNIFKNKESK